MTKIITAGRTDLKDFFEKSGNFTSFAAEAKELEAFFNQHSIPITVKREEKQ